MRYSVEGYTEGAPCPYVRNPARTADEASALADRMRESAKRRGWRVTIRVVEHVASGGQD